MDKLTDESIMPGAGKHAGKKMANVPADYLIWVYENNKCSQQVREYVKENYIVLLAQNKGLNKKKY